MTPTLEYIKNAIHELEQDHSIDNFLRLRYHIMSKECPHNTFSVEQGSWDFFETARKHINGTLALPVGTKDRPLSEYDHNYIKWIKEAQAQLKA